MVNILNKISLKNMQIVILLYQLHHNLSCIIVRTLLNRHFQHSQNFIDGKSFHLFGKYFLTNFILGTIKNVQKYANRDIIASITSRLNQELDITGLPSSFYMTPSEIFIRNNKNMVNILNKISLKNMQIVILLLQLHHSKCGTRHNRFYSSFYMTPSRLNQELDITGLPSSFYMTPSEIFIRNNKNMVNILNKISLKNMQIVILLYQLHHNLSCIIVRTLLNRHFQHSQNFIDGKSLYLVSIFDEFHL